MLLCGYTPFRSDDMKELKRQTTEARVNFHDRYWKNVSDEGMVTWTFQPHTLTTAPAHTAKAFIRALINPDPTHRLTAEQALAHPWLTTFDSPTEHDLTGLRENFDPRARWRNAIGAARILSRFSNNKNGAGANKDKFLISDDEDEDGENGTTRTSWRTTPDTKKVQRRSSPSPPSSPEDHGAPPRQGLAGLAGLVASSKTITPTKAAKTTTTTTPPSMSFSEAINKAKAAEIAVGEKTPNSRASPSPPKTQSPVPVASQPSNGTTAASASTSASAEDEDEDEEEDEDVTLRIPGSFDLENYDDGGVAGGIDAVSVLGDLWRRMQLR